MPANWEKHRAEGYDDAAQESRRTVGSPRVKALIEVATCFRRAGRTKAQATHSILTTIGTSSRVQNEYVTGVVAYVYDTPEEG